MSYDTSIMIDTGGEYPAEVEECGNMTSNIGGMYYKAMPGPYAGGGRYNGTGDPEPDRGGLPGLSGLSCSDACGILKRGLTYMEEHEPEMRAMEPDNGWGSFEGALKYLRGIYDACRKHPRGFIAVNW